MTYSNPNQFAYPSSPLGLTQSDIIYKETAETRKHRVTDVLLFREHVVYSILPLPIMMCLQRIIEIMFTIGMFGIY